MNVCVAIAITVLAALCCRSPHAAESAPLRWDCARTGAPSLRETAATYGYDNYTRVVPARAALYQQIRQACAHGADRIVVVEPGAARRAESHVALR